MSAPGICTMGIVATIRSMLAATLALVALAAPAAAQSFPPLTGRVVDAAQVLGPSLRAELAAKLRALEAQTSHQLVIATVPSLNGHTVEDYANRLFRAWKLGRNDQNDGVLLLVAPTERKLRIEVGYGLEGVLPDAIAKVIIEDLMVPQLRAGRIDAAVTAGAEQIIDVIAGGGARVRQIMQARAAAASHDQASSVSWGVIPFLALIPILIFVAVFFPSPARRPRPSLPRGPYGDFDRSSLFAPVSSGASDSSSSGSSSSSSDSSSSDSFSGGGGSSGGGGASGSW
jgi:uncharacterized protein